MKVLIYTKKHTYNITDFVKLSGSSIVFWGLIALGCYFESLI